VCYGIGRGVLGHLQLLRVGGSRPTNDQAAHDGDPYGIFAGLAEGVHTGPAHVWFQYLFT
ncbi:MAG: hypothetical protein WBQ20_00990, partial [Methyloceanibacter sp.]